MAEINNVIAEASQDLQTIEDFVNLPAGSDVRPRLLPSVNVGTLAGTRDAIFRAGGLPAEPFETLANMETDGASLPDGQLAMVHNDTDNNGLYVKTAGAWVKSSYDPSSNTIDGLDDILKHLLKATAITYKENVFKDTDATYQTTDKLPTYNMNVGFARLLLPSGSNVWAVYGYDKLGNSEVIAYRHRSVTDELFFEFNIPEHITHISARSYSKSNANYRANYTPFLVLADNSEVLRKEVSSILKSEPITISFPNPHLGVANRTTYDSTDKYPVLKGSLLDYHVNTTGEPLEFINGITGTRTRLTSSNRSQVTFDEDGVVYLSTLNDNHASYIPDFEPYYQIYQPDEVDGFLNDSGGADNNGVVLSGIPAEYLPTMHLKTVRQVTFLDGTPKKAMQYLWYDKDWNFYISNSKRGERKKIFTFIAEDFKGREPHQVAMDFDPFGNIVCVFKVEHLQYSMSNDSRENPIILEKGKGYKSTTVDFGSNLKPCGWIQNSGFLCTENAIFIAEYTRPSVPTAQVWKATYPLTDSNNWKVVQEFEIHHTDIQNYVKHVHCVDRDPFTGFIYTGTGDSDIGSSVYVSKDGGDNFEVVIDQNRKYARTLNWIFTKDYIYWAADNNAGPDHGFFRTPRLTDGTMDYANVEDLHLFLKSELNSPPTYATIHMLKINALVFLHRQDTPNTFVPIDIWDFEKGEMSRLIEIPTVDGLTRKVGFRCDTHEYYPRDNEIICGFSETLGSQTYQNNLGVLGNTADDDRVNNLIIVVDRVGDGFTVSFDTVI